MFLKHKNYEEPIVGGRKVDDVKQVIRDFVGSGKKSYETIIAFVQRNYSLTNDEIVSQILEVSKEKDYQPVIEVVKEE